MVEAVNRWIVCVTGFMQPESRLTGVEILQDNLRRRCQAADAIVALKAWADSPWHIAERIWNRRPRNGNPHVVLIGYSWGGYTAVKIARELQKRGIEVEALLLCDAVWRSRTIFFRWLSMLNCWTIRIPANVRKAFVWRQANNRPCGSRIKVEDRRTLVDEHVVQDRTHQYMDDDPEFHAAAYMVACPHARSLA